MSAFRELAKQRPQEEDSSRRLLCTEPGCGARWSVNMERPLCSRHAWGEKRSSFVDMSQYIAAEVDGKDGRTWARRIVRAHESGAVVRPASLKMAQAALKSKKLSPQAFE